MIGIPIIGQRIVTTSAKMMSRITLAGIPHLKNSPDVNCFESYAIALGAAPTSKRNGIPATTKDEKSTTSGATFRYGAITNATGRVIAILQHS